MSERIEELSKQAWEYADKYSRDGDGKHGGLYKYKFAELLIAEVIGVINQQRVPSTLNYNPNQRTIEAIQHHFT